MKTENSKPERPVNPEKLTQLIERADRVIVRETPWVNSIILFESENRTDLDALNQCLLIEKPKEFFHCKCDGTPAIFIYCNDNTVIQVTNHHGVSIRCSLWDSDARIINVEKWISWFDKRGIEKPRKEVNEARVRKAQHQRELERWMSAMPEGLATVWKGLPEQFGIVETAPLRTALRKSIPEKKEQIQALLSWFGSGAGPWSGFPSYESAAEELLLDYKITEIVNALEIDRLTPSQIEGATRLFSGWSFSKKHPEGIRSIPKTLKKALWNHMKNTEDKYKLTRAKRTIK